MSSEMPPLSVAAEIAQPHLRPRRWRWVLITVVFALVAIASVLAYRVPSVQSRLAFLATLGRPPMEAVRPEPLLRADNRRGVYLSAASVARDGFLEETMQASKQAGGNAIVIDVKTVTVHVPSDAPIAQEIGTVRPLYDLPAVVEQLHQQGFFVIARFVALKDQRLAEGVPETQLVHAETGEAFGSIWVDGSHAVTLEYNRQILREVAASGVDEINLDYIRYPTEYPQSKIGLTGAQKAQRVVQFVRMAREVVDDVNPRVRLGISTYAILGWDFEINLEALGQDFVLFAPYVDIISPMAYVQTFPPSFKDSGPDARSRPYYLVYRTMLGYADRLGPEHEKKLRPWIQGYDMTVQDMRDQIQAVRDAGYCGYTVWSAGNLYGPTYPAIREEAEWPVRCQGEYVVTETGATLTETGSETI